MGVFSIELPDRRVVDIEAPDQETALRGAREWHSANPQPELSTAETVHDVARSFGRGAIKGAFEAVTIPYRLADWLGEKATGGGFLPNLEENSRVAQDALNPPAPRSRAGRYAATTGEFVGAGATLSGAGLALAARYPANWFLRSYAATPAAAVGTDTAASLGAGLAVEYARESGAGTGGQVLAGLGGGLAGALSLPMAVRSVGALPRVWADERGMGILPSFGGGPNSPKVQGRAYQIFADTLSRAGKTPDELRTALAEIYENTRFNSNSYAQEVTALGDLDESLMRLAGSIARQNPEASRIIRQFLEARQTGHTPRDATAAELFARGLPTRQRFAEPMTVQEARNAGLRAPGDAGDIMPMGLVDNAVDALRRAFLIEAHNYHGHARTGMATERLVVRRARDAAQKNYDDAVTANQGVNLRQAVDDVFDAFAKDAKDMQSPSVEALIRRVQSMFRPGQPLELRQFDRIKRELDDIIKGFLAKPNRSGVHKGGYLSDLQEALLKAVDDATGGEASLYRTARNEFASEMKIRDAYRAGLKAFDDESEVTAQTFMDLATKGEQQAFRLGELDSMFRRGQRTPRTHDFTKVFETKRVEEILSATIPRSKEADAVFANRPERFGGYIDALKRSVEGRSTIHGGSQTAKNQADDAALSAQQTISNLIELSRAPNSWLANKVGEFAERAFGESADVMQALAHMLFTANPEQRLIILREVAARMPPDRMTRFRNMLSELERAQARTATLPNIVTAAAPQQQAP